MILVVGGGPVGLFLGCALARRGLPFQIVEARVSAHRHSRAVGIHPPALERFEALGLAHALVARGVKVTRGRAFAGPRPIGTLSFESCPPPFPFILTLPQHETEALLEATLLELAPNALRRGVRFRGLHEGNEGVTVTLEENGRETQQRALVVVGCDGKGSAVRQAAGFAFAGRRYPDTYLMGDFADDGALGPDAGIYLCRGGLLESFPLPGGQRRWVAKTDHLLTAARPGDLTAIIRARLGTAPDTATNTMLSAFGVAGYLARPFARGRVFLAGDAAHVVSPIGGQGMNLGWLDAWEAAERLERILGGSAPAPEAAAYAERRRRAAARALRRAELNTRLGRRTRLLAPRAALVRVMLELPAARIFARLFTMRWL